MESGGGSAAGGGGAGGDGVLCHACGYQYPNGHPSAKQRRAHRKHCGKPASAAAAAEEEGAAGEHGGGELPPGRGGVEEGIGASAAERGGSLPGSANAVEGGDSAEHSSGNGTGHQVIGDEYAEDHLICSSNIPSEITSEAGRTDDDTLTTVATQYHGAGSPIEGGDPSDPAVGSEQLEDVPTSVLSPEPQDGAKSSSKIPEHGIQNSVAEYETQNSTVVPLESNVTGGGTSEQTDDAVSQVDGIAVTEEDAIGKNKFSEDKSVEGNEFDLSCQDILQTKIGEGHSGTAVEKDYDKNLNAIHNEETLSDETESNQQSKLVLTDSIEKLPNVEVPVESSTGKCVDTDDDLLKLGTGGSHSETPDDIKPQQQPGSTSETAGHLAVSKEADNVDEQHNPFSDGSIPAISSASGPAVGGTASITDNVCSSDMTVDDSMQKNVTGGTIVASDLVELSTSAMPHEINMVGSTNDVDEKRRNEKGDTDLDSYGGNELHVIENFEEKQQNKEVIVIPHKANTVSGTDNHGENEQNKEIIADTSSSKISVVQSMTTTEEKEQIEEFSANLASEETSVTCSRDIVEEKQVETDVKTSGEIDAGSSIKTAGENNATTCEINAGTATDDVEGIVQNEEITTGPISTSEEKIYKEEVTEALGSHENLMVHGTDNVEEKTTEETTADATSHNFSLVTSTDSVEAGKVEETAADSTLRERSAVDTTDNIDERKNEEPVLGPTTTTSATICSIGDVEEKKQSEETAVDPTSGESNTLPGTEDAENKKQNGSTATTTGSASDKTEVAQTTNVVEEIGKTEDTSSKEISTIESTDGLKGAADQNEEIADKEMVIDSDKNHVSLKVLLADKNVETKEKEKKASTKDRVLSFKRRASKDNVSPVKPGSPKAGQDWNSPARLPVEKKPKGRKQQWVPFICCSSVQ